MRPNIGLKLAVMRALAKVSPQQLLAKVEEPHNTEGAGHPPDCRVDPALQGQGSPQRSKGQTAARLLARPPRRQGLEEVPPGPEARSVGIMRRHQSFDPVAIAIARSRFREPRKCPNCGRHATPHESFGWRHVRGSRHLVPQSWCFECRKVAGLRKHDIEAIGELTVGVYSALPHLLQIRNRRLYRDLGYADFESFCIKEFGFDWTHWERRVHEIQTAFASREVQA